MMVKFLFNRYSKTMLQMIKILNVHTYITISLILPRKKRNFCRIIFILYFCFFFLFLKSYYKSFYKIIYLCNIFAIIIQSFNYFVIQRVNVQLNNRVYPFNDRNGEIVYYNLYYSIPIIYIQITLDNRAL